MMTHHHHLQPSSPPLETLGSHGNHNAKYINAPSTHRKCVLPLTHLVAISINHEQNKIIATQIWER